MTREQFKKAEKIVSELEETEYFLKLFKKHYRLSISAYEQAPTNLDSDRERIYLLRDGEVSNAIEKSLEERIKRLNDMLSEV